ncbi:MAG: T9SS type A sorting domain-containing protein [Bacteroidetes bacterium]|nr:T9SS type A sorting domain-containing protein [Bacteroidota bacterium]
MKKILLFVGVLLSGVSVSQTAANFNTNDCASTNHDLFTELNSGKVVVITWVMPCVNCVGGATSAQNAVNSFSASNPGQVVHYIADDYGNSTCATVTSWCATYSLTPNAVFTSSAVSMSPYASAGMPKVIVLGGTNHNVFYNVNGSGNISVSGIQSAISNALATVGMKENNGNSFQTKLSPNPVNNELTFTFKLAEKLTIEIYSVLGQKVKSIENVTGSEVKINTESLCNGSYFARISDGQNSETIKFLIAH